MARPFTFPGARSVVIKWQLLGIASVLATLGVGFLAVALDLWLGAYMGASAAAAATAGLLALVALACVGGATLVMACGPKAAPAALGLEASDVTDLAAMLIGFGEKIDMRTSAKPMALAALVVGCVIGYSPALQRTLKNLIG